MYFIEFIQSELDEVREHWNSHCIRKSAFSTVAGQPEELFFLPESFGYEHRNIQSSDEDITKILEEDNFLLRAEEVIKAIHIHRRPYHPLRDWEGARELYKTLVNIALF